jgi:hypothetical protein
MLPVRTPVEAIAWQKARSKRIRSEAKTRLVNLSHVDRRTRAWREARKLAALFAAEIGGELSAAHELAIERAATLVVLARDAETRCLRGEDGVSLNQVVRATRLARLAVKDVRAMQRKPQLEPSPLDVLLPRYGEGE